MTCRPDLAALTDDALALVANRGLVKRAARMFAEETPELLVTSERILVRYGDGVETSLPAGIPFSEASCTCGASSVCRHRVGLVLVYRANHGSSFDHIDWTPGEFDDEALEAFLGGAVLARANRTRLQGYQATVHRARGTDPVVRVELPHCTVRFLVPHELSHAHSSASAHTTAEAIALAVWAVRAADESGTDHVHVGRSSVVRDADRSALARALARTILVDGLSTTTAVQHATAVRDTRTIEAGSAIWLADACIELTDQIEAYSMRHAGHSRTRVAMIIAEIHARVELGESVDSSLAGTVLGTETPGETPLRRSRLISLGARVTATGDSTTADIYFAEPDSDAVFLMSHDWSSESDEALSGYAISTRRIAGSTVAALASSTVLTESAVRRANHRIRLGRKGIGRTSILPLGVDAWEKSIDVVDDYAEMHRRFIERPPSFARARLTTDGVGVMRIDSVISTDYAPAEQIWTMRVGDGRGNLAQVSVVHRAQAPGAIDAMVRAMSARPRAVRGRLTVRAGALWMTPFAVACDLGVIVPDLEEGLGSATMTRAVTTGGVDAIDSALEGALSVLADIAHRGLRNAAEPTISALRRCAAGVVMVGMDSTARALECVADAISFGELETSADAWVHAVIRIVTAIESR